jgi:aspartate/methionine/tyrosine aminotransferase
LDERDHLWVAERDNHRVALYSTTVLPGTQVLPPTPLAVLGQPDAVTALSNHGGTAPSADSLRLPEGVAVEIGSGALGPVDVIARMSSILGHVGAWAPRAEQVAAVALLDDAPAIAAFHATFKPAVERRLELLHAGFQRFKAAGLPVDSIAPMGALYLTARIDPFGRRAPSGTPLQTNEDVRRFLLEQAGVALVPFQAFGVPGDEGWFRLSVGAVSEADIEAGLARLEAALRTLQ